MKFQVLVKKVWSRRCDQEVSGVVKNHEPIQASKYRIDLSYLHSGCTSFAEIQLARDRSMCGKTQTAVMCGAKQSHRLAVT